tara:strand:+ start:1697 stop:2404 length:708 start_codon:yes stop_codon:yes gene_type:complete
MSFLDIKNQLKKKSSSNQKKINKSFFKTQKGEYSENDYFIGLTMGQIRGIAKKYDKVYFSTIKKLLYSKIHEERMLALIYLINEYDQKPKEVFNFYIKNIKQINNWDLVDISSPKILGRFIYERKIDPIIFLKYLYNSKSMWERRISIVCTLYLIKKNIFKPTIYVSKKLLNDKEDLIHKAVGWMLREVWKKNENIIENFICTNYINIPRTTLRYTIEKMEEKKRKKILKNELLN